MVGFDLSTFMHADSLIAVLLHSINCKCCDRRVDCWVNVLVPLPEEDRVLQANLSFWHLCKAG
jgi:hypothetical protein